MNPTIRVLRTETGEVQVLDMEEYVRGVLPKEVYPSWPMQCLMANATLARTYGWYYKLHPRHEDEGADVCDKSHCQNYGEYKTTKTNIAVSETSGLIMVDDDGGRAFPTFYASSCGGSGETEWDPKHLKGHDNCPCSEQGHKERSGHGHGGCQWGSYYLATQGWTMRDILDFYFQNYILAQNYGQGQQMEPNLIAQLEQDIQELREEFEKMERLFRGFQFIELTGTGLSLAVRGV